MPAFAVGSLGSALRSARVADFSPEQQSFLTYGRGVDTTMMRDLLGFEPRYTTAEALADFAAGLSPTGGRTERALAAVAERLPSTHTDQVGTAALDGSARRARPGRHRSPR